MNISKYTSCLFIPVCFLLRPTRRKVILWGEIKVHTFFFWCSLLVVLLAYQVRRYISVLDHLFPESDPDA